MLRPILKNALPVCTNIDAKLIDNFRRRVALYHARNPNFAPLTLEQGMMLTSRQDIIPSDLIGMNDPITLANLNKIYGQIMKSDSNTWSAIQFLKHCKNTVEGFDYRVLYNKQGLPIALLYMTSRMRYNLLC